MKKLITLFLGLLLCHTCIAQVSSPSWLHGKGTDLPIICNPGDHYTKLDASTGGKVYVAVPPSPSPCTWEQQSGVGASVPSGLITFILTGTCPTGWSQVTALDGVTIYGTLAAHGDVGGTIGSASITPTVASTSLTAAAQTFTGDSTTVPAETISGSTATEAAHTHSITQSSFTTTKFSTAANGSAAYVSGGVVTSPSGAGSSHSHGVGTLVNGTAALTPLGHNASSSVSGAITMNSFVPQFSGVKAIFCSKD